MGYMKLKLGLYRAQAFRAKSFESFALYRADKANDELLDEFLGEAKKILGDEYERPKAFERFRKIEAYAYEEAHPGTVWEWFTHKGKRVGGYTLDGTFEGEEESSIRLHAYECGCDPSEIGIEFGTK